MWHTPHFPGRILVSPRDRGPIGSRRPSHRRTARPRLEALEGRALLSVWTVTNNSDKPNDTGSLRWAIKNEPSGTTIEFAKGIHSINLTNGELNITSNLDIQGPGCGELTISGQNVSRVFDISPGTTVTITGLRITDGVATGATGVIPTLGGGILNQGDLTLSNDVLASNKAQGAPNVPSSGFLGGAGGGGVANLGTLTASDCQFIGNQVIGAGSSQGFAAGIGRGGAIANTPAAALTTVAHCQFTGNVAQGGCGDSGPFTGAGFGGAISNASTLTVTASSFDDNQALGGDGNGGSTATGFGIGGAITSGNPLSSVNVLTVSGSQFDHNQAVGGTGNTVSAATPPLLAPNSGDGGAIMVLLGSGSIDDSTLEHNQALGGQGTIGSNAGNGIGGAMSLSIAAAFALPPVVFKVTDCTIDHNGAVGGPGGSGTGQNGGTGLGGGIVGGLGATVTVLDTTVARNDASGGDGDMGKNGGDGLGGGVYNNAGSTTSVTASWINGNLAVGGDGSGRAATAATASVAASITSATRPAPPPSPSAPAP